MSGFDDLEGLRQRHLLDPADGSAAYALAQGLKRASDPFGARAVCVAALGFAQPLELAVGLRQLVFSLGSPRAPRSWAVVGEFSFACNKAEAGKARLFLLPDAATGGEPSALWAGLYPSQGIVKLLSGEAVTERPLWMPSYWEGFGVTRTSGWGGFGVKELAVQAQSSTWAAVGAVGAVQVWAGDGASERARAAKGRFFIGLCATSRPGDWLVIENSRSDLVLVSVDPAQARSNKADATFSDRWFIGGCVSQATLTPDGRALVVNTERGLTLYDRFNARQAPLMLIEDSLWMSSRATLSRAGDRVFNLNVWERAGEQAWWWLSLPDQQRYRFVTSLPDLRGWCTCPSLQTLAFWTHDGTLHFWDIEAAASLCELHLAQDPKDPYQVDHLAFDPQMRFAVAVCWHKKRVWLLV